MSPRSCYSDYVPSAQIAAPRDRRELFCNVFYPRRVREAFMKDPESVLPIIRGCGLPDECLEALVLAITYRTKYLMDYMLVDPSDDRDELEYIGRIRPGFEVNRFFFVHLFSDFRCGFRGINRCREWGNDIPPMEAVPDATLMKWNDSATVVAVKPGTFGLEIPAFVRTGDGVLPVNRIKIRWDDTSLERLYLPNSITTIHNLDLLHNLKSIWVDPNNPYFGYDGEGVLRELKTGKAVWERPK